MAIDVKSLLVGVGQELAKPGTGGTSPGTPRRRGGGSAPAPQTSAEPAPQEPPKPDHWETMANFYEETYRQAVEDNAARAKRASEEADREAELQRSRLTGQYRDLERQLYRDYMESRRTLPQQLSAQGFTGGLTESGQLRLRTAYGEALSENERARFAREGELEGERAEKQRSAREREEEANAQAMAAWRKDMAALMSQHHTEENSEALRHAQVLAAAGDFSGYAALGYSEAEIRYLENMWKLLHPRGAPGQSTGHYTA